MGLLDPDPLVRDMDPAPIYHQAEIVRKSLIPIVLRLLYDFLSLNIDVNVASNGNQQKNLRFENN